MAINISASLIEDYLSCNRKVHYRINRPKTVESPKEAVIGDAVHRSLELFWDDRDKALDFVNKVLDEGGIATVSNVAFSTMCIDNFFDNFRDYLTSTDAIEKGFKIQIERDVFVVGKMDRISNNSVFDWKTSRNPPSQISNNVQFVLYNWAYEKLNKRKPTGVYYGALTKGKLIRYRHESFYEDVLINQIIPDIISSIRNKRFSPNGVFRHACFRCQYSSTCLPEISNNELDSRAFAKE